MNSEALEALGLSLVHSLWQGAALLFIVLLGLVALRNKQAKIRYGITLTGILLLPCILAVNLLFFWPEAIVDNYTIAPASIQGAVMDLPTHFQQVPTNPQSNPTVLWLKENASTIALLWLVGMALFLLKVIGSFVWMKRLTKKATLLKGQAINRLIGNVKAVLGIKTQVYIKSSPWIKSPLIMGIIRPTILFPIGLIEGLTIEEVEAILYHELAHFKRNDFVINIIINVLQIVFFYHPAYWWMKSQLDNEREYATDELALKYSEKKLPMIKALAKVQAFSMSHSAIGFAGNSKNQVLKRINIMMNSKQQPNWLSAIFTIAILLVAFGLMSVQDTKSKTDKKDNGTSMEGVLIDLDAQAEKSDSIWSSKPFFIDLDTQIQDNDSTAVSKAILDLIQNRGSFEIEFKSNGEIKSISKNGAQLSGKALKTYESAWHQIDELNSTVKTQEAKLNEILRREENLLKSLNESAKQIRSLNPSSLQRNLIDVQKQLVRTQAEYERILHEYNQISSQGSKQDIEEYKSRINNLNQELERLSKVFHEQLSQKDKVRYSLNDKYEVDSIWLNGKLLEGTEREFHLKNWSYGEKERLEREYVRLQGLLKKIAYPGNVLDSAEVESIKNYQDLLKPLEEKLVQLNSALIADMEVAKKAAEYNAQIERELAKNTISLPGGEANEGILNVLLEPFVDKKSTTVYILDNKVLTDSDKLEEKVGLLKSIQIIPGTEATKDFFGREVEGKKNYIWLSTKETNQNKTNSRVQFQLDEEFKVESILIDGQELLGEEREKALQEYRRHRELEVLSREKAKLSTIIQSYENQGLNNSEIQTQLTNAHKKADMLSARISDTYKFIRENREVPEIKYASIGISHKMDSLSINHILGNPTQSVFYLNESNRKTLYNNAISNLKKSSEIMIDLDGKLKKGWTLDDIKREIDVETISHLVLVKGNTMYNYHSKRKLGGATALLRVITKD